MDEAALEKQLTYAKLLKSHWGYPLYVPRRDIRIGDVARFVGSQFAKYFNVFDLSPEVRRLRFDRAKFEMAAGLNIEVPRLMDWEKVVREEQCRIHSVASDQVTMQAFNAGAGVSGAYKPPINPEC